MYQCSRCKRVQATYEDYNFHMCEYPADQHHLSGSTHGHFSLPPIQSLTNTIGEDKTHRLLEEMIRLLTSIKNDLETIRMRK